MLHRYVGYSRSILIKQLKSLDQYRMNGVSIAVFAHPRRESFVAQDAVWSSVVTTTRHGGH
jgi:hypothetical protein